jgi:hypothetical protein
VKTHPKSKILVIDTEQYAGNFEREMCAYLTGQVGDCGVGSDVADKHSSGIKHLDWWKENIAEEMDDDGVCSRPASIWSTEGWFNNGYGGFFKDEPKSETIAIEAAKKSEVEYNALQVKSIKERIERKNFETTPNGWTEEACLRTLASYEKRLEDAGQLKKHSAYLSVAIFVKEFPPEEVWEEFKERAAVFCQNYKSFVNRYTAGKSDQLTLTGFRHIEPEYKLKQRKIK